MVAGWSRDWTVNGHAPQAGSLRIYGRILRGICATAGVFSQKGYTLYFMPRDVFRMQASKAISVHKIIE